MAVSVNVESGDVEAADRFIVSAYAVREDRIGRVVFVAEPTAGLLEGWGRAAAEEKAER